MSASHSTNLLSGLFFTGGSPSPLLPYRGTKRISFFQSCDDPSGQFLAARYREPAS
jgi:hypothetical protein